MLRALCIAFLFLSLNFVSVFTAEIEFHRCNCDGDGSWSIESIFQTQKVSDFLIATAYFSIPLELLYFVTCTNLFPFKWVLFQFGAFIVLCGLTHLLNVFTYEPHSFLLMLSLTISKFLTALVSFATAIALLTLIPQLLKVKVRESYLMNKARDLNREVGMMKRQEEASWHVRMLTQEIRKSIDRHTILYTTLVELSKTLGLQNCAVWMPSEDKKLMNLTHELRQRDAMEIHGFSIPVDDADVIEIKETDGAKRLERESKLGLASSGGATEPGAVAAIRMPMLSVSNFKGGTPQVVQTSYAILVLVLPRDDSRVWNRHELDIIEVVADQVAVALSHAAVLEESQLMRDQLEEQNRALLQAKQKAMMASEARNSFQRVMSHGMRKPIHSILGLLSMMEQENLGPEQMLMINSISKTSSVVSTLINDVMEISTSNRDRLPLEMQSFHLHSMIKEAVSAARCLCDLKGLGFGIQVENAVPDRVIGDEKRIFHVILHMVGNLLSGYNDGFVALRIFSDTEVDGEQDPQRIAWKPNFSSGNSCVKFEIAIKESQNHGSSSSHNLPWRSNSEGFDMGLSFNMCKKVVQLMQGNIWAIPNSKGLAESMTLVIQFQLQPPTPISDHNYRLSTPRFKGLRVLLADDDAVNRVVTQKLLEKLGCQVSAVSSGTQCLSSLGNWGTSLQLVILDLHMPNMDGFEVAMRIRKFRSRCWPLIVALTASAEDDVWERCLQAGMNGLIRKPVNLKAMGDELLRVLQNT
ncbi:Non-specific serine/threonine protein kinase protein [Dioscorea alata]|uniref:Non-specific serine/threonine protein kinase protein n=1 Tax=Dioscorea alata TaxID=55571 RepID=A0ACB7WT87_DIOAL|nr:Non-specific serine/threonine protein kinase protein [Dioscorea alata]